MHPSTVAPSGRHPHLISGCNLQAALSRGLLPDDETLKQLILDPELPLSGRDISLLRWPEEPLRFVLTSRPQAQKCPAKGSCDSHRDGRICDGLTQDSASARGSMPACHPCWGFIYMLTSMQGHCRGWVSAGLPEVSGCAGYLAEIHSGTCLQVPEDCAGVWAPVTTC